MHCDVLILYAKLSSDHATLADSSSKGVAEHQDRRQCGSRVSGDTNPKHR